MGRAAHPGDRLDSWKEIAAYLNRGVRTVRRWEEEEGLPVHRHVHRTRAASTPTIGDRCLAERASAAAACRPDAAAPAREVDRRAAVREPERPIPRTNTSPTVSPTNHRRPVEGARAARDFAHVVDDLQGHGEGR